MWQQLRVTGVPCSSPALCTEEPIGKLPGKPASAAFSVVGPGWLHIGVARLSTPLVPYFFNSPDGWTFDSGSGRLGSGSCVARGTRVMSDHVSAGGFGDGDTIEVMYEPDVAGFRQAGEPSLSLIVNGNVIASRIRVGSIPEPEEGGGCCWVVASAATGLEGDQQQTVRIRRTDPAVFLQRLSSHHARIVRAADRWAAGVGDGEVADGDVGHLVEQREAFSALTAGAAAGAE